MNKTSHKMVIDLENNVSHGKLFNYSKNSIYVKLAESKLIEQRKTKNVQISDFKTVKNIISERDLLLTMFEIEEESQKKGINLRKAK